jgi:hypothetical protein
MFKWYKVNPPEFALWWQNNSTIPWYQTLFDFITQSDSLSLRADNLPKIGAVAIMNHFIFKLNNEKTKHGKTAIMGIQYLSWYKELSVVNVIVLTLVSMGYAG